MHFAVVFDLFIAFRLHFGTVIQEEGVGRITKILLFYQDTLKSLGVEAKRRATLQALLVRVQVDILEILVGELRRHVSRLGDR